MVVGSDAVAEVARWADGIEEMQENRVIESGLLQGRSIRFHQIPNSGDPLVISVPMNSCT